MNTQGEIQPRSIRFDEGPCPRGRLGFVCVANAGLTEGDMHAMCPPGIGLAFTRVPMKEACTIENLAAMEYDLDHALAALMPARTDLKVISYNCTSGSFVIGEDVVRQKIVDARPGIRATTMLTGIVAAIRDLGLRSISLGTAYTPDLSELERVYFESVGVRCNVVSGLSLTTDAEMNQVSPRFLFEFARSIDRPESDAVILSCGALRSLQIVDELERVLGKPVICSNQASFWHSLRLAGINDPIAGFGGLLRRPGNV